MATNPQAAGQTKISFQISDAEKAELQKLADASGMKLSAYVRKVLDEAVETNAVYSTHRAAKPTLTLVAVEDPAPYGAKRRPKPGKSGDQAG